MKLRRMYLTSVVGLIFGLLLGGVGEAFAQTAKAITGNVSDEKGEPIISGTVKREMRIFHELVGFDEDTVETANELLKICKHHLVVKRPSNEAPLVLNAKRSSFIDGKACRFDCYYVKND